MGSMYIIYNIQSWDYYLECILSNIIYSKTIPKPCCSFFSDNLLAFQNWLEFSHLRKTPPEELPILLQGILAGTENRSEIFKVLAQFIDLGPWAAKHIVSVGIITYV